MNVIARHHGPAALAPIIQLAVPTVHFSLCWFSSHTSYVIRVPSSPASPFWSP
jgi:hypothetical protein